MVKAADVEVCRHSFTYSFKNTHWNNVRYQWYTTRLRRLCAPPQLLSWSPHIHQDKHLINSHQFSFQILRHNANLLTWESYVEQTDFWTLFRLGNPAWEPWNLTQAPSLGTWKPLLRTLELIIWRTWSGSLETLLNWELENLAAEVWNVTWKTLEPGFENLGIAHGSNSSGS